MLWLTFSNYYINNNSDEEDEDRVITKVQGEAAYVDSETPHDAVHSPAIVRTDADVTTVVLTGFTAPFDKNGVLFYLGTNGGTEPYQNPHLTVRYVTHFLVW
jgi:hypothetical protein